MEFLYLTSKVQSIKGEIDKPDFIKIKNFCSEEDPVKRMKRQDKDKGKNVIKDQYLEYIRNSQTSVGQKLSN